MMNRIRVLWGSILFAFICVPMAHAQRAVFVVRHAERADDSVDTVLSSQGKARAHSLARLLRDAAVSVIYVTQYRRSVQTAEPLAELLKLQPTVVQADDITRLVTMIRDTDANQAVLVVGHSNTVPDIISLLGCRESVELATEEYDNLFIVVPCGGSQHPVLLRLRF